ncbi:MAG: TRAP transporter small permease [Treponema sp.]|nr:TRAP transporter small permease [Treponema sp.]
MGVIMKVLNRIIVIFYDLFETLGAIVLAVILSTVLLGIVSRYVFNRPFIWTEEVCTLLMVYLAYLSAPLATISKEHVVADFFKNILPKKFDYALTFIIRLFEIFFFVYVALSCIHYIPGRTYITPALRIPRIAFYVPVLAGTLVILLSIVIHVLNDLIPGYDYFWQRKEAREKAMQDKEKQEERKMLERMDSFLDEVEKQTKRGSV